MSSRQTGGAKILAIHGLTSERFQGWFDSVIVEVLIRLVPPLMVGSMVKLSNGSQTAAVTNHPEAACKPTVRLVVDGQCERHGRELDLRMCSGLRIAEVDGVDV